MNRGAALSARIVVSVSLTVIAACRDSDPRVNGGARPASVRAVVKAPARYNLGALADSAEIAAWNIDANSDGEGLPPGSGNHADGARLYAEQCAACHGQNGEGGGSGAILYPKLISKEQICLLYTSDAADE